MNTDAGSEEAREYRRFLEMLPWFVNKSLSAEDAQWVQSYIGAHPAAKADLEFEMLMAAELSAAVEEVPASMGRERLKEQIRQDVTARRVVHAEDQGTLGLSIRQLLNSFLGMFTAPRVAWAMGLVVALQFGYIHNRSVERPADDTSEFRALPSQRVPVLRIQFRETATEQQISRLLVESNAMIVGGPSQLGEYEVASKIEDIEGLRRVLKASDIVDFVSDAAQ